MSEVYPELHSLPDECWLPSTLTSLVIGGMPNLTSLSKGIHNLTSLDILLIQDCPNLRSLPDKRTLDTLSRLMITECPLLEQRCLKDKGADWHKIADIPCIVMGDSFNEHFNNEFRFDDSGMRSIMSVIELRRRRERPTTLPRGESLRESIKRHEHFLALQLGLKLGQKVSDAGCGIAPLAVKTLGGVLRNRRSPREWKDVLDSEIWDLPEDKSSILPTLRLSYHHLPSQLKQMFAYCAIFPKDYEFDKDELVLLWMAEGFLQQSQGVRKLIEELGDDCFNELLSRSFFQPSSSTKSKFTMHDLLNDLAQHVAGEICFMMEDNTECIERCRISPKARHSAFMHHEYEMYKKNHSPQ
ncbi:unnamed protein product [Ilex paraguariensis]|uniref:Disease resistance protein winged helix domain-containing protein n=1 Tax=Ilex paraguariensis TaxID=185542 RepID=A0ABC8S361_9AQUA